MCEGAMAESHRHLHQLSSPRFILLPCVTVGLCRTVLRFFIQDTIC